MMMGGGGRDSDGDDGDRQIREMGKEPGTSARKVLQKVKGAKLQRETETDPR